MAQTRIPRYLTLAEACEILGCGERTIRRRIASGELKAYRLGNSQRMRIREDEIADLMQPIVTVGTVDEV
ncbi:helix-turn-helix domain-containing protein [Rhodococcus zopfii]|uniref:helix-turn-helix domain-containing protein n=1 Tax=Rhodococcus zopfii TaxID=43772 RepID=UPI00111117B3|nr:helix-turn-helix domain-containing protein [Rhodococcus zopfii]